jgi:hypothetical protein
MWSLMVMFASPEPLVRVAVPARGSMPDPAAGHERAAIRHAAQYAPVLSPRLLTFAMSLPLSGPSELVVISPDPGEFEQLDGIAGRVIGEDLLSASFDHDRIGEPAPGTAQLFNGDRLGRAGSGRTVGLDLIEWRCQKSSAREADLG